MPRKSLTLGLIVLVLVSAFACWRWLSMIGGPSALIEEFGGWAPLVSVPIHVLLSSTPFPSELVGVVNGSAYGFWIGSALSWAGWWMGALLEYSLVRCGLQEVDESSVVRKLPNWLSRYPVAHPAFLILGRQVPFGFHAVNILAALAGVSLRRQLICAGIANLPYAILTAAAGAGLVTASWFAH